MTTKLRLLFVSMTALLFLSACTVSVFIGALTDKQVSTSVYTGSILNDAPTADTTTLAAGDERIYQIDVTSTSSSALYLYVKADLDLYVYNTNGSIVATSDSADFFAASYGGLASTSPATTFGPTGVSNASLLCPGSCVIQSSNIDSPIYARVENPGASAVNFSFFAVTRDFEDASEATGTRVPVSQSSSESGALETLGDVDGYELLDGGILNLGGAESGGIIYEAEISDPFGGNPTRTIRAGQSVSVDPFEVVDVYAANGPDRAAAAGNSTYFLFYD